MSGRKNRRVKVIPKKAADMAPIIRWGIRWHLQLIEEVACGPQASGTGAPGMEEAAERILRSLGTDWKAKEEAILDRMRVQVMEWWQNFLERQLLTDLYRRAALRRAKCGPPEYAPAASCESTSGASGPAGSTSTLSGASAGSLIAGARPSPQCSPSGSGRLPAGTGGVPPASPPRPIAPSGRPNSGVTSGFSSPSRSWKGLEYRRGVVSSPAVVS